MRAATRAGWPALPRAVRGLAAVVPCLVAWSTAAALPLPHASAVVSVAEGGAYRLIRGATVYAGGRGVVLHPGDMIETPADSLLVLDFNADPQPRAVAAIGPASRVYWQQHRAVTTLALLRGWVKVDTLTAGRQGTLSVLGTRLGAVSSAGIYVAHAGESLDEVFHESGAMTLLVPESNRIGDGASLPGGFAARAAGQPVRTALRADAAFVAAMPAAFRDPLPSGLSAQLASRPEPAAPHAVEYADVADWLAAPLDWRRGFIERFRPRLRDRAFREALDAHLDAHPEWLRILHPPAPAAAAPRRPAS